MKDFKEMLLSGELVDQIKETAVGETISNSVAFYNIMKPLMASHKDVEKFYIIFLNSKNQILGIEVLFSGTLTSCFVYPREVIKKIIHFKASSIVLSHNHPSGSIEPSPEDFKITKKIMLACSCIDVKMHDHIIIGDSFYSMEGNNNLDKYNKEIKELLENYNL